METTTSETTRSSKKSFKVQFDVDYTLSSMDECKRVYNQVHQLYSTILELEKIAIITPIASYKQLFTILDQISMSIHQFCPAITHQLIIKERLWQTLRQFGQYRNSDKIILKIHEIKKGIDYYIDRFHHLLTYP
jgi:hypothetical protein